MKKPSSGKGGPQEFRLFLFFFSKTNECPVGLPALAPILNLKRCSFLEEHAISFTLFILD
jgi:hypothetical protein